MPAELGEPDGAMLPPIGQLIVTVRPEALSSIGFRARSVSQSPPVIVDCRSAFLVFEPRSGWRSARRGNRSRMVAGNPVAGLVLDQLGFGAGTDVGRVWATGPESAP